MDSGNHLAHLSSDRLVEMEQGARERSFQCTSIIGDGIDEPIGLQLHWNLHWASQPPAPPIIPHANLEHRPNPIINHGAAQPLLALIQDDGAAHDADEHAENRCGDNCVGVFVGVHQCARNPLKITCGAINCRSTFHRRTEFNRHFECSHSGQLEKLDCPHANCPKVGQKEFSRKDNLLQHRRKIHKERISVVKMRLSGRGKTQTTVE